MARTDILFPPGRLVAGNLYKPKTTDEDGKPLVYKTGPNAGQPREDYFFAVAIPKTPGHTHWNQTVWGQMIWAAGAAAFPAIHQARTFAWKVTDGDSPEPNKKGKRPCDRIGYPGHWVVGFSSSFATKVYNNNGTQPILEPNAVKPGYYVQVFGDVDGNGSDKSPGVFINHRMVAFAGYGEEIQFGPDASAVGFGQAALPAGASAAPPAGMTAPPATLPAAPAPAAAPAVVMPPPTVVQPHTAFLAPAAAAPVAPAVPSAPPVPAAPPVPPVRRMTELAKGVPYESFIAQGWNDAQLIQNGYMLA